MAKITDYDEKTNPNGETDYFVIAYGGLNYKVKMSSGGYFSERDKKKVLASDFTGNLLAPFINTAITGGSITLIAFEDDHPGILQINTTPAGLYMVGSHSDPFFSPRKEISIDGQEVCEAIIRFSDISSPAHEAWLGFFDDRLGTASYDGIHFFVNGTTLTGETQNGAASQTTPTSYTIIEDVWYHFKMVISNGATRVDFYLYDMNGILLWGDSLNSPPSGTANAMVFGIQATGGILDLDLLAFYKDASLTR